MGFGLAPSASPYARLARLPPACTGCRAFQLTPLQLAPDSHRKLCPPAAPCVAICGLRRRLQPSALPPIEPPVFTGGAIFQLLRPTGIRLSSAPASFGSADEELSVFTGCSIVSLRWRLTSCFRKRPDLPVSPAH